MLVHLDDSFVNDLVPEDGELVEQMLESYLRGLHLLTLSARSHAILEAKLPLGVRARRALGLALARRLDYAVASKSINRSVVVISSNERPTLLVENNILYLQRAAIQRVLTARTSLFVEHVINDGRIYRFLADEVSMRVGSQRNLINFDVRHGGGSSLGDVICDVHDRDYAISGLCIVDRDGIGIRPPFKTGSTGERVANLLHDRGLVDCETLISTIDCYLFKLTVTPGWAIENIIGPNMVDFYYSQNRASIQTRGAFLKAFPGFPKLSDYDIKIWHLVNFRKEQDANLLENGLKDIGISVSLERLAALCSLTFPGDLLSWLVENTAGGRLRQAACAAFEADMALEPYRIATEAIARDMRDFLAGDKRILFM